MKSSTLKKVRKILAEQLEVDPHYITPQASLAYDLGADSLDSVELVMALEEEFDVEIPDELAEEFITVRDIIDYLDGYRDSRVRQVPVIPKESYPNIKIPSNLNRETFVPLKQLGIGKSKGGRRRDPLEYSRKMMEQQQKFSERSRKEFNETKDRWRNLDKIRQDSQRGLDAIKRQRELQQQQQRDWVDRNRNLYEPPEPFEPPEPPPGWGH